MCARGKRGGADTHPWPLLRRRRGGPGAGPLGSRARRRRTRRAYHRRRACAARSRRLLDELTEDDFCMDDGHHLKPAEVFSYLTRVIYNRRNKCVLGEGCVWRGIGSWERDGTRSQPGGLPGSWGCVFCGGHSSPGANPAAASSPHRSNPGWTRCGTAWLSVAFMGGSPSWGTSA